MIRGRSGSRACRHSPRSSRDLEHNVRASQTTARVPTDERWDAQQKSRRASPRFSLPELDYMQEGGALRHIVKFRSGFLDTVGRGEGLEVVRTGFPSPWNLCVTVGIHPGRGVCGRFLCFSLRVPSHLQYRRLKDSTRRLIYSRFGCRRFSSSARTGSAAVS